MTREELDAVARRTLDAGFRVHSALGPGMLESAYTACLAYELQKSGLRILTEVPVPVIYDNVKLTEVGYRMDILVEQELVIEVKSLDAIGPVHFSQLVSYLKLADKRLGFLLNFNVERFKDGISRRVHRF